MQFFEFFNKHIKNLKQFEKNLKREAGDLKKNLIAAR